MLNCKIAIIHSDTAYGAALAKRLSYENFTGVYVFDAASFSGSLSEFNIIISSEKEILKKSSCKGILLTDDTEDNTGGFLSFCRFQPVRYLLKIFRTLQVPDTGPVFTKNFNTVFTVFTSAAGGAGTSSCALCYGRIKSRLYNSKTSFVSLDPSERRPVFPLQDEYGLIYENINFRYPDGADYIVGKLSECADSGSCTELVIDLPLSCSCSQDILDMCENRVVVMGWNEQRFFAGNRLYENLNKRILYLTDSKPTNYILYNHFDNDYTDIHGQLGAEVMALAKGMEKRQV